MKWLVSPLRPAASMSHISISQNRSARPCGRNQSTPWKSHSQLTQSRMGEPSRAVQRLCASDDPAEDLTATLCKSCDAALQELRILRWIEHGAIGASDRTGRQARLVDMRASEDVQHTFP